MDVVVEDGPEEVCLDDTSEEDEGKADGPGSITNNFYPILFFKPMFMNRLHYVSLQGISVRNNLGKGEIEIGTET